MPKWFSARTALSIALACGGISLISGCGTGQQQADRDLKKSIDVADLDRARATDLDSLDRVQATYDRLAATPTASALSGATGVSPAMHILVRGRQTQLRMERIQDMMADLRAKESAISKNISQIEQFATDIAANQASIDALKSYDPTTQIATLKSQQKAVQGTEDVLTWTPPSTGNGDPSTSTSTPQSLPTISAIDARIASINAAIAKNGQDTDSARTLSSSKTAEADTLTRKAEGETGDAHLSDLTQASNDRRDAAIADASLSQLLGRLARLQGDLLNAQNQKTSLETAVATLDAQVQALQSRWSAMQEQITAEQATQQRIISGGPDAKPDDITIASSARDLAAQMGDASRLRQKIDGELNSVVDQFKDAITTANAVRSDVMHQLSAQPTDPDADIWKQTQETLHPMYYLLQKGQALQDRATLAAEKLRIDQQISRMFDGYTISPAEAAAQFKAIRLQSKDPIKVPGIAALLDHEKTGIDMPKEFSDLPRADADQLSQHSQDVKKLFDAALEVYNQPAGGTDSGPPAAMRTNSALVAAAGLERQYADFDQFMGDSAGAADHIAAALDKESQVDPSFRALVNAAPVKPRVVPQDSGDSSAVPPGTPATP